MKKIVLTQKIIKQEIKEEFIRLDSFLKLVNAVQSGGEAKLLITDGLVFVNGEVCTQRGKKLYDGYRVKVNNKLYEVKCRENNLTEN